MENIPLPYAKTTPLTRAELEHQIQGWLLDGEVRQLSSQTLAKRRLVLEKLLWLLRQREADQCGTHEIRAFLAYLHRAHESETGRWESGRARALRPASVQTYFVTLRAFFRFCVAEGVLAVSPMERLQPPVVRADQIQPFTVEQVESLLAATARGRYPRRDRAIVLFLLDTGCRASELCALRVRDVDLRGRSVRVKGKGNKYRTIYFGREATRALWAYLGEETLRDEERPLFVSERADALTRSGLLQLVERLGREAGIDRARCSPHTFRHTFAVQFLRNGGNTFTLKELLGHTTLAMTQRYVALAEADLASQHRAHSPADNLRKKR